MSRPVSATSQLISLLHDSKYGDLPAAVVDETKRLILDTIGCALGARNVEAAELVIETGAALGGPAGASAATIVGTRYQVSPAAATSTNMYLGNLLDADDTYLNFSHPAVGPVFSALAFIETLGLSGKDLIAAVALGYEVGCRVGKALVFVRQSAEGEIQMVPGNLSWHGFCVAGAAGKVLGLDPDQLNHAFGLAAWTSPIQTGEFFTTDPRPGKHMLKYSPVGFQGMTGVMATQLAQRGFLGEPDIFDAPEEFWISFGVLGLDSRRMLAGLGESWQVCETSYKPYAMCRFGHAAVDLFDQLRNEHGLVADEIDRVVVRTFDSATDWLGVCEPAETAADAQFSIPQAIAAVAYGSDLGPSWQTPAALKDPRRLAFAHKVQVTGNPDTRPVIFGQMLADGRFRQIPNEVVISARGQEFSAQSTEAWGDPWTEETRMTDAQMDTKFRTYAGEALPQRHVDQALHALRSLEEIDDVSADLMPLLRP